MASDLCKKLVSTNCPNGQTWDGNKCVADSKSDPPKVPGCMIKGSLNYNELATVDDGSCIPPDNTISGQTLRSKHLKIVSSDLYYDPAIAKTDRNTGRDTIRGDQYLSSYGLWPNLSKVYTPFYGGPIPLSADPHWPLWNVIFDLPENAEQRANTLYEALPADRKSGKNPFTYINFSFNLPFNEKELQKNTVRSGRPDEKDSGFVPGDPRISTYKFEPKYNYFLKGYEDMLSIPTVDMRAIPNAQMYYFLLESLTDKDLKNYDIEYLRQLAYSDTPFDLKALLDNVSYSFGDYLKYYVEPLAFLDHMETTQLTQPRIDKNNNLIVTQDDVVEYNQFTETLAGSANYGFYLEMPFEPPQRLTTQQDRDDFKKILKITNTDLNLYNIIVKTNDMDSIEAGGDPNTLRFQGLSQIFDEFRPESMDFVAALSYIDPTKNASINQQESWSAYNCWDFTKFFSDYEKLFTNIPAGDKHYLNLAKDINSTIIGETNEAIQKYQNNSTYDFFQNLMGKTADYRFGKIVENMRINNPVSLFDTMPETPYEVLFFRIGKADSHGNIQNFYIPNPVEEDKFKDKLIKFFDSQVKYGENYTYDVFAYPLVLGKKYYYTPVYDLNFTPDKIYDWYVVFQFLDYYLSNYQKLKDSRGSGPYGIFNALGTMTQQVAGFKKVSLGLVNTFIDSRIGSISATGTGALAKKTALNKIRKDLRDFINNIMGQFETALDFIRPTNCKELLEEFNSYTLQEKKAAYDGVPWSTFMDGRFNALCGKGKNLDKWKDAFKAIKNRSAPFYGIWYSSAPDGNAGGFQLSKSKFQDAAQIQKWTDANTTMKNFMTGPQTAFGPAIWKYSHENHNKDFPNDRFAVKNWFDLRKIFYDLIVRDSINLSDKEYTDLASEFASMASTRAVLYQIKYSSAADLKSTKEKEFDKFEIHTEDYIPLMEIPMFSVDGSIMDSPPVAPKVSFVPFKDVDNRVLIKLNSQSTQYYEKPIAILAEDQIEITKLISSRGTDKHGRLLYRTDDYLSRFEIFRMEEKPKSYKDFASNMRKKADLEGKYSAFSYLDEIVANKKYYYTFRSLDDHAHHSNPTPVYEFILNDDGGFLYPEVKIVDFEDTDYYDFSTKMQKYIQIKPSAQNVILNPELIKGKNSANDLDCATDASKPPPLGVASNSAWGKKFKLRITSKTSGKKVDVNFTFERKHKN